MFQITEDCRERQSTFPNLQVCKQIVAQRELAQDGILKQAFDFDQLRVHLIAELARRFFVLERLLLIDGKNKTSNSLVELNTLENPGK